MTTGDSSGSIILDRERAVARAEDLCAYVDAAPMPHHAAAETVRRLEAAGSTALDETADWSLEAGGLYHVVRGGTTVAAFRVGTAAPAEAGLRAIGAHLDSPNLRVKPFGATIADGHRMLAVDVYGGVLLTTWFDRDLGVAGRVVVRDGAGGTTCHLMTIGRPVARVSNLAIHLNRQIRDEGFKPDAQRHTPALVGLAGAGLTEWSVAQLAAAELSIDAADVLGFDLGLFDVTPSAIGGIDGELIFAPRLDNLGSSHAALAALIAADAGEATQLILLWDHEECGSGSAVGAGGTVLVDTVRRVVGAHAATSGATDEAVARARANSLMVSADMAHAVHPNYGEMHEPAHRPRLGRGPVIKHNVNQRYATTGKTAAAFTEYCRAAGFEPQQFVTRGDLPCGSTIGPIASANSGIATVDVGNPMLSMHSIREMACTWDHDLMIEALLRHLR